MAIEKAVVDSSVLVALLTPEKHSEWVEGVLSETEEWFSLDLIYYEVANAIWKKYKKVGSLGREDAYKALEKALEILRYLFKIYSYSEVVKKAFETAEKYDITVYDAAYIVLAKTLGAKLITLDRELLGKLGKTSLSKLFMTPE